MHNLPIPILLAFVVCIFIFIIKSVIVIPENRRGVLFRLGKFIHVMPAGLHIIIPFIDAYRSINLNEKIPGWQGLSVEQLDEKVRSVVLSEMK